MLSLAKKIVGLSRNVETPASTHQMLNPPPSEGAAYLTRLRQPSVTFRHPAAPARPTPSPRLGRKDEKG